MTFDEIVQQGIEYERGYAERLVTMEMSRGEYHARQTAKEGCHKKHGGVKEYAERLGLNYRTLCEWRSRFLEDDEKWTQKNWRANVTRGTHDISDFAPDCSSERLCQNWRDEDVASESEPISSTFEEAIEDALKERPVPPEPPERKPYHEQSEAERRARFIVYARQHLRSLRQDRAWHESEIERIDGEIAKMQPDLNEAERRHGSEFQI